MTRTDALSAWCTSVPPRRWRLRFWFFLVRMWRRNALPRLTVPPARFLKRLAAPRLVFNLGITLPFSWRRVPAMEQDFGNPDCCFWVLLLLRAAGLGFHLGLGRDRLRRRRFTGPGCLGHRLADGGLPGLLRRQHHDQLAAFHLGVLLDDAVRLEVVLHALDQAVSDLLVGHFAAAVAQGDFRLVAFFQEPRQVAQLDLVVALVGPGAKLDLLDDDLLLLELGFVAFLGLTVLVFPVIHDAAHRGLRGGCDLDQVELGLFRHLVGDRQGHHADLLAGGSYQTDLGRIDLAVDPRFLFLCDVSPLSCVTLAPPVPAGPPLT